MRSDIRSKIDKSVAAEIIYIDVVLNALTLKNIKG